MNKYEVVEGGGRLTLPNEQMLHFGPYINKYIMLSFYTGTVLFNITTLYYNVHFI